MSSYQTLARYNECRQRDRMPYIREQMRNYIDISRLETRHQLKLQRRKINNFSDSEQDDPDAYLGFDEVDCDSLETDAFDTKEQYPWCNLKDEWSCWPPSNAPSPSLSNDSEYSSASSGSWPNHCDTTQRRPRMRPGQTRTRKEILLLRKRVQQSCYDGEEIIDRYESLRSQIMDRSDDPNAVASIVCASWNTLADAMDHDSEAVKRDSINLLTQLIVHNYIQVEDVLLMFQKGLILTIKSALARLGSQQLDVVALITGLVMAEPRAIAYLVELMRDTGIIEALEEMLVFGSDLEVLMVLKLYCSIFDLSIKQMGCCRTKPIVPETLVRTTPADELISIYNPISTLRIIATPKLINQVGVLMTPKDTHSEDLVRLCIRICAHSLTSVQACVLSRPSDRDWALSMLGTLVGWHFDELIVKQSGPLRSIKEELRNFSLFYQDMYVNLRQLILATGNGIK